MKPGVQPMWTTTFWPRFLPLLLALTISLGPIAVRAAPDDALPVSPRLNQERKWRIGYLQGGAHESYPQSLAAIAQGLMRLGWLHAAEPVVPENAQDSKALWQWLATQVKSDYLEFVADAWHDAQWSKEKRPLVKKEVVHRLNSAQDIDLMLAMGTWAGQDLATTAHAVPTIVCATTDAVAAGIIKSAEDSGFDHIHAQIDPDRYQRQVRLFHNIFTFPVLGVVFEDSLAGRGYSAVDKVCQVARENGFRVEQCLAPFSEVSQAESEAAVVECYRQLAEKTKAVYILRHPGITPVTIDRIMVPLIEKKIPTFSQSLADEVRRGVLISISPNDFSYTGDFHARTMARIFNGAKPRNLTQVFHSPLKIALNLKNAQLIGYDPSVDIIGATDKIFTEITAPLHH